MRLSVALHQQGTSTHPTIVVGDRFDGGCVDKISLSQAEMAQVWKPSFYWEGAKSITMPDEDRGTGQLFEFYPDGSVWWSLQASFKLSCPFAKNLDPLPFDTQAKAASPPKPMQADP